MLLDGLHVPITTPFYPDGALNLRKLEHNVDRLSRTPAAGILVLGANGEATTLTDVETRQTFATTIAAAAPEKVMLAGIARDGVPAVLDLADYAATLAYDAAVLGLPAILLEQVTTRTRETLTWFQTIADRSALPILLASQPGRELTLDVITELAGHPMILGIVDAGREPGRVAAIRGQTASVSRTAVVTPVFAAVTRRMAAPAAEPSGPATFIRTQSLQAGGTALAVAPPVTVPALRTRTRATGFQFLTGSTAAILWTLKEGATGAIPPLAACAPQSCFEVLAAWKDGDQALAEEKQERLQAAVHLIEERLGVPAIKYACDLNGYFGGTPRLPHLPASAAERKQVEALLDRIRN